MNKKYIKYINYIVKDIEKPYFINMRDHYGLKDGEYKLILDKVFNQSVTIKGEHVYNTNGKQIYYENSNGYWYKREYDSNGKEIYRENSDGDWRKYVFDANGNLIYRERSNGFWYKREYDSNGNRIYYEDSDGVIRDYR